MDVLRTGHDHDKYRPCELARRYPDRWPNILELNHLAWHSPDDDADVEIGIEQISLISIKLELFANENQA